MNWFDWGLAVLVVMSVAAGARKGLSRSGFGLIAVVAAFLLTMSLYPADWRGFLIVFVVAVCAGAAGASLLGGWLRAAGPKWLDGVAGGVFGLVNALLFSVLAVLVLMVFTSSASREYVARSASGPYVLEAGCAAAEMVPDKMKSRIERSYQELARVLPRRFKKAMPPLPRNEI